MPVRRRTRTTNKRRVTMKFAYNRRRRAPSERSGLTPDRFLDPRARSLGPVPGSDEILFLPLGGCDRIGMNMTLYGHAGKWLIVDAGVAFMGDEAPGIDAIMADPRFVEERANDVVGLVVTHAHEDTVGAIHHWGARLSCPIYATPFAAHVIRERLKENGTARQVRGQTMG